MELNDMNLKRVTEIIYEQAQLKQQIEDIMVAANGKTKDLNAQIITLHSELIAIKEGA